MVQNHFIESSNSNERSFKMFTIIGKKILPPNQLREKLLKQMRLLNKESQKEKEYEIKRKEYANCYSIVMKILHTDITDITSELIELSEQIKDIENMKIPLYNKYINRDDIKIIESYCEKNSRFSILLPSTNVIEEIHSYQKEDEIDIKRFSIEMKQLQEKICLFLDDLENLKQLQETYSEGKDLITEKKLEIAQKYIDCPQIHIPWFKTICKDQEERENHLEAGIAIVHIINFIYQSIKDTIHPLNMEYLQKITNDFLDYKQPTFQSGTTSLDSENLVSFVTKGVEMFTSAHLYSFAISLYNFIIPYFISNKNYKELSEAHKKVNQLYQSITQPFVWYYYHVGFYGKSFFGKDHGKEYIYRSSLRLTDFLQAVKEMHKKKE